MTSDEMVWVKRGTYYWPECWAYVPRFGWSYKVSPRTLRIIKDTAHSKWQVRFEGREEEAIRGEYPIEIPLEEIQAVAVALWKMK